MTNHISNEVLAHYGVLGMKWGVRKDGKPQGYQGRNKKNPNYSSDQRERDSQLYGKGGPKRINRKMNKGSSVSTARGVEIDRRNKVMNNRKKVNAAGRIAGGLAGLSVVPLISMYHRSGKLLEHSSKLVATMLKHAPTNVKIAGASAVYMSDLTLKAIDSNPKLKAMLAVGIASSAQMTMGKAAVKGYVKVKGYDPKRKY